MLDIEGDFSGEVRIDSIKYSKILMRSVTKSNKTSGKITIPYEHIGEKVVILIPFKMKKKRSS